MKNKDTYEKKIQNTFTAYVVKSVEGRRKLYLAKRHRVETMENYLEEDSITEPSVHFEDYYTQYKRENLLEREIQGTYLTWDELSDRNLVAAIRLLKKEERELLFQHIFEEKSFDEISQETGVARNKVENWYYYAVKKIHNWMGGAK